MYPIEGSADKMHYRSRRSAVLNPSLAASCLLLALAGFFLSACSSTGVGSGAQQTSVTKSVPIASYAPLSQLFGTGSDLPLVIFVHGNGDNASIWKTTLWRFESNGWPRQRLHAMDSTLPLARSEDSKEQAGRSSTVEQMRELSAEVDRQLKLTGANKVVLIGNSRGGYSIRNYIRNGDGKGKVVAAVLGGVPNHGVWTGSFGPDSEFNGSGPFLTQLNSPQGPDGSEVTAGVAFLTLRSDKNDKFAQPMGQWIGQPKLETGVTSEGPALKGATNLVLPGKDHREVSFHPDAFAETFRFLTGYAPTHLGYALEPKVILNGKILGLHDQAGTAGEPSNLGLPGTKVTVFQVQAETGARLGAASHQQTVKADGAWGPFNAKRDAFYEFVIEAPGFAINHIYRSPFPRSSNVIHMRPARVAEADKGAISVVTMNRPRGYFGVGRDIMSLDQQSPPPGLPPGVPGLASSKLKITVADRPIVAEFNGERIVARSWPLSENRLVFAEFTQ
jgi:triacylglycerol lipase